MEPQRSPLETLAPGESFKPSFPHLSVQGRLPVWGHIAGGCGWNEAQLPPLGMEPTASPQVEDPHWGGSGLIQVVSELKDLFWYN